MKAVDDSQNPAKRSRRCLIERLENRRLLSTTTILWNTVNQTITGFGASSAWTTQSVTNSQSQLLWSTTDGAGLSLLRSRINEDATTLSPNTPQPAGSYEVSTMKSAVAMGVTVWSTPWSPPAAWKSNQSVDNGGSLLPADYQAYANYLAQYVVTMKNDGIPLYGISLQNEPDFTAGYDSCIWTASQFAAFLPDVVTAFGNYNVSGTKIILPEESGWHWELANTVMTTPSLNADVSVYAGHDYDGGSGAVPAAAGKQLWMTEVYDPNAATGIAAGLWVAQNVYNLIVTSGANAYHYWWIQSGGASGNGQLLGPSWEQTQLFWGLANYSKFIRPGWNNIGDTNDGGLTTSAFANTATGQFATVLVNSGAAAITEAININGAYAPVLTPWVTSATQNLQQQTPIPATGNGGSFTYTIPAKSIVTLTGIAGTTPITTAPPGLTATPAGATGMSLAWTNNVAGATGYTLQRSIDDSNWTTLSSTLSNTTYTYPDSALSPNTLYYYRVIANNGTIYSNVSYAMTLANPVTNLTASFNTGTAAVTLNWKASTTSGVDYEVLRSSDGGTTWTQLTAGISNGTNTYTDSTAPEVTALQYQLIAIDGTNTSAAASVGITTTVVRAPSGLNASSGSAVGSVALTWTNNSNQPAVTYVERSSNGGSTWMVLGSVAAGVTTYTDPSPGTGAFQYEVRAYYNSTYSAFSNIASINLNVLAFTGGSGANTFYFKTAGTMLDSWINAATPGSGTPTQTNALSSFSSLAVTGGSGDDSVTLDYSGGDPTQGGFNFNGGSGGNNALTLKGSTTNVTAALTTSLAFGNDGIYYSNLNALNFDEGSGSNTLNANTSSTTPVVTLTIDSGSTLLLGTGSILPVDTDISVAGTFNLSGQSVSVDQITGSGTVRSSAGTLTVGAFNSSSNFAGVFIGGLSLDKIGTGTFTNTGNSNYTGNTTVDTGALTFGPTIGSDNIGSTASSIFIAPANTDNGTLNIGPNVNLTAGGAYNGIFLACNSVYNNGGGIGQLNQTGGSLNVANGLFYIGGANTAANGANGAWNFSGGVANISNNVTMSVNNNSISNLYLSGSAQLNMLNSSTFLLGQYYGRPATITQTGGSFSFYSDGGTTLGGTGSLNLDNGGGTYSYNFAGGTLSVPSITAASSGGSAAINFSGGTLVATDSATGWIASTITPRILAGGAIFNTKGYAVSITQPLIHDSALGSTADGGITVIGGGALTLSATSTYTGPTNVSSATLTVTGSIATSRSLIVGSSGTFNYLPATTGTLTLASGSTLTLASGSTLGLAVGDRISVAGAAAVLGIVNFALSGTPTKGTSYTLITAGSGLGSASLYTVSSIAVGFSGIVNASSTNVSVTVGVPIALAGSTYLQIDPSNPQQLDAWTGTSNTGSPTNTYLLSQYSTITVSGTTANDTLTIDFSKGNPLATLSPGVTFDTTGTAGGNDSVLVIGDAFGNTYNESSGQLLVSGGSGGTAFSAAAIHFPAPDATIIRAGTGLDSLTVSGNAALSYTAPANGTYPTANLSSLSIASGSKVTFLSPGSGRALLELTSAISWAGTLDLRGNDMLVKGGTSTFSTVSGLISSGSDQGLWTGSGIDSSVAAGSVAHLTSLGMMQNNQSGSALFGSSYLFDGVAPAANDVLVKYTYYGDANLNGTVASSDYTLIDGGYLNRLTTWFGGDFNYDGIVNGSDYTLIDNTFNTQGASLAGQIASAENAPASVPPPIWTDDGRLRKQPMFASNPAIAVALLG